MIDGESETLINFKSLPTQTRWIQAINATIPLLFTKAFNESWRLFFVRNNEHGKNIERRGLARA